MSSPNITITSTGLPQLADTLAQAGSGIAAVMEPVVRDQGRQTRDMARVLAKATSRKHGRLYVQSITDEVRMGDGGIFAEVGPDADKPQGGMSFEHGSVNQAPHNDIDMAGAIQEPLFVKAVEDAVDALLRANGL